MARAECARCGHTLVSMGDPCPACSETGLVEVSLPQRTVGEYRLLHAIGKGGFGEVYLGEQTSMKRLVAIKLLHADLTRDERVLARFRREAVALSAVAHPNIVTVYSFGTCEDGTQYLAMEYVDGTSLRRVLREAGPLPLDRALDIAEQMAEGLSVAHDRQILHRDLKPENVLLTTVGDREDFVKVLDFGIAGLLLPDESDEEPMVLTTHGIVGTPLYISPEQAQGLPLDGRSDVYALGILLYEMLSGQFPYHVEEQLEATRRSPLAVMMAHVNEQPVPLTRTQTLSRIPAPVDRLVLDALEKVPGRRVESMRVFRDRIRACRRGTERLEEATAETAAYGPVVADETDEDLPTAVDKPLPGTTAAVEQAVGPGKGGRLVAAVLTAAALVLVGVGAGLAFLRSPAPPPSEPAPPPEPAAAPAWVDAALEHSARVQEFRVVLQGSRGDETLPEEALRQVAGEAYAALAGAVGPDRPDRAGGPPGPGPVGDLWSRLQADTGGPGGLSLREWSGALGEQGFRAAVRLGIAGPVWEGLRRTYLEAGRVAGLRARLARPLPVWSGAGALLTEVEPRGRAATAGLAVGDLLTRVEGQAVAGPHEVATLVRQRGRGQLTVVVVRAGTDTPVEVPVPPQERRTRKRSDPLDHDLFR